MIFLWLPNPYQALRDLLRRRISRPLPLVGEVAPHAAGKSLAEALRERTRALHVEAERSGVIQEILGDRVTRSGLVLLLRNLLPVYQQLELGLARHQQTPGVQRMVLPALYRAPSIVADLVTLEGADWSKSLPLLPAAASYARQVAALREGDGTRLVAHAYVRYLGDLSGGQVVRRLVTQRLHLEPRALSFYEFREIADLEGFKVAYRSALNQVGLEIGADKIPAVLEEAALAFQFNIQVSQEVQAALTSTADAAAAATGDA